MPSPQMRKVLLGSSFCCCCLTLVFGFCLLVRLIAPSSPPLQHDVCRVTSVTTTQSLCCDLDSSPWSCQDINGLMGIPSCNVMNDFTSGFCDNGQGCCARESRHCFYPPSPKPPGFIADFNDPSCMTVCDERGHFRCHRLCGNCSLHHITLQSSSLNSDHSTPFLQEISCSRDNLPCNARIEARFPIGNKVECWHDSQRVEFSAPIDWGYWLRLGLLVSSTTTVGLAVFLWLASYCARRRRRNGALDSDSQESQALQSTWLNGSSLPGYGGVEGYV